MSRALRFLVVLVLGLALLAAGDALQVAHHPAHPLGPHPAVGQQIAQVVHGRAKVVDRAVLGDGAASRGEPGHQLRQV